MAAARLTEWRPAELVDMPAGEILRWIEAKLDAEDLIEQWFDLEEMDA